MHFSKTAEYAIRILVFMSYREKEFLSVATIQEELSLPPKYTAKLMTLLANKNLLERRRGREGGFRIAKKLPQITLKDILFAVESEINFDRCILGFEECSNKSPCSMHHLWEAKKAGINKMINEVTLQDLKKARTVKN